MAEEAEKHGPQGQGSPCHPQPWKMHLREDELNVRWHNTLRVHSVLSPPAT